MAWFKNLFSKSTKLPPGVDINTKFAEYAKSANPQSDGKTIDLETTNKWMNQAGVFDSNLTTKDTSSMFEKLKKKAMDQKQFIKAIADLCKKKKINFVELATKLMNAKMPEMLKTK